MPPQETTKGKPNRDKPPDHVRVYFDLRDQSYWYLLNGRFVSLKKSDIRMHMRALGLSQMNWFDGQQEVDWPLYNAQLNYRVDYAGALAGHRIGILRDGSNRQFLVTDEAAGVWEPIGKGPAPEPAFFGAFIRELLQEEQWTHFCFWLAIALRSLRRGDFRPGQVAVLAGPAQCGKSLLQFIITEVLGGRVANPWNYMAGDRFNYDLAGAEHWMIEDPNSTTDMRTRVSFGNKLKECANNESFNIHRKNKDPLSLPLFRRLTLSCNDEPEFLAVIPPMDKSVRDKLSLYRCTPAVESLNRFVANQPALPGMESIAQGDFDRAKVKAVVRSEVPGIRAWLLTQFRTIPRAMRDNRCGIGAYHHPELLSELSQMSAEHRLLNLIDEVLFEKASPAPWSGKAMELESTLRESKYKFEVEKVLRHMGQLGSYLGKLAKQQPLRVQKHVKDGYTRWTITTPPSWDIPQHEQSDNTDNSTEPKQQPKADPQHKGRRN